jgi:20S proteasome alpha/beta subunit
MTLCIAAACEHEEKPAVVLCSDWRGETDSAGAEIVDKFRWVKDGWPCLIAGSVSKADELVETYERHLEKKTLTRLTLVQELKIPLQQRKTEIANEYVQRILGISYSEFLRDGLRQLPQEFFQQTVNAIANLGLECDLIIAGCLQDESGDHLTEIFRTDLWGNLFRENDFSSIGSGANVASAALFQREHTSSADLMTTLYHLYEAKRLGEVSPGVGTQTSLDVLFSDGTVREVTEECFKYLEKLYRRFGPRPVSSKLQFKADFLDEEAIT